MSLHLKSLLEDKWLLAASFSSAEYAWHTGRISDAQWEAYQFIWTWGAAHFGTGLSARKQDAYYSRFGDTALLRRRSRVAKWIALATDGDRRWVGRF